MPRKRRDPTPPDPVPPPAPDEPLWAEADRLSDEAERLQACAHELIEAAGTPGQLLEAAVAHREALRACARAWRAQAAALGDAGDLAARLRGDAADFEEQAAMLGDAGDPAALHAALDVILARHRGSAWPLPPTPRRLLI